MAINVQKGEFDMKTTMMLLILFTLFSENVFAQDDTQWSLPAGAKARLGKGNITGEIAYSPDSARLAVASSIGIWLYDTQTYQEVALLTEHTDTFSNVAFSPDGRTLAASGTASGSWDDIIRVWDVVTGIHKHTLVGHSSGVTSIAFSPDGRTLASGGRNAAHLWDIITGTYKGILTGHSKVVISVAFSPDGETLAGGSEDNTIYLWEVATGAHTLHSVRMDRPYQV